MTASGAGGDRQAGDIAPETVLAATGRSLDDWFALLDAAGGTGLPHRELAALVDDAGASAWWSQSVAVAYERARGLRARHQKSTGFSIGASRTVAALPAEVWTAWMDAVARARWLPDANGMTVRTATEPRSARFDWPGGGRVVLTIAPVGADRARVVIEHERLPDAESAAREKAAWRERLGRLANALGERSA